MKTQSEAFQDPLLRPLLGLVLISLKPFKVTFSEQSDQCQKSRLLCHDQLCNGCQEVFSPSRVADPSRSMSLDTSYKLCVNRVRLSQLQVKHKADNKTYYCFDTDIKNRNRSTLSEPVLVERQRKGSVLCSVSVTGSSGFRIQGHRDEDDGRTWHSI